MAVDHYENFPVASLLCPPDIRPAVVAIYHFARTADDLADEGDVPVAQRLADLAAYRSDLVKVFAAESPSARWSAVFLALDRARQQHRLPFEPLAALLDAFELDAPNPWHADRASLLRYCERSANPVGRLLLHLYGIADADSVNRSDRICTALQLINFWQDLGIDLRRRRLYLPLSDLERSGLDAERLLESVLPTDEPALQRLVGELNQWAIGLMQQGAPLARRVPGRAGWELRLVVQGGLRIAEKLATGGHRPWRQRPKLGPLDLPLLIWRACRMGRNTPPLEALV